MTSGEIDLLLKHFNGQRQHLINTMDGLDDETFLQQMAVISIVSRGPCSSLTHDVERFWFRQEVANELHGFTLPDGMEGAW